jgi:hypothetical protein
MVSRSARPNKAVLQVCPYCYKPKKAIVNHVCRACLPRYIFDQRPTADILRAAAKKRCNGDGGRQ